MRLCRLLKNRDIRQISEFIIIVKPVSHYKVVRYLEPHIVEWYVNFSPLLFIKESAYLQTLRPFHENSLSQIVERYSRIDDIIDKEDIFAGKILSDIIVDRHLT